MQPYRHSCATIVLHSFPYAAMLTDLQAGFQAGPDHPAASAALEGRLLPLVCTDIDLVAAGRLRPEVGVKTACVVGRIG